MRNRYQSIQRHVFGWSKSCNYSNTDYYLIMMKQRWEDHFGLETDALAEQVLMDIAGLGINKLSELKRKCSINL